jgi:prolyl-tRNA editing enzyme YbaK/EbsC (Cys-tRNA(Pro) deacylase)
VTESLSASAQRVQDALQARGLALQVRELPQSTRTAAEAAQAVGCQVGQIAKSLVFKASASGRPILVITSGTNRASEQAIAEAIGEPVSMADPAFVRTHTGFAIGGVPPIGHTDTLLTLIDEDLLAYPVIWAAAGTPRAVFPLDPSELSALTGGRVLRVRAGVPPSVGL